ncbi:synaptopodin-2 [Pseudorasbora parva]|uniref:synaptopodin-2 n=1 Tax=Pseudorasbora parva TaxID=51549 RepID=UPI00351E3CDB
MEHLPQTKGKGVLMFAKRRQRMDELSVEQEEMRRKGIPVDAIVEPVGQIAKRPPQEESTQVPQDFYERQQQQYQEQPIQQKMMPQSANGMNGLDPYQGLAVSRPLVPNRTAKPFLGGHNQSQKTFSPVRGASSPTHKKPENIFKVPVPVNTTPQVWSPTSDIIASRDERIAIPAIKTGILPESKRRGASKTDLKEMPQLQKKEDQKSLTESVPEEDFLSLGAEACNFMQAPTIKQKNPPPVLPKPVINPAHPPWSTEGHAVSRSPLAASSSVPVMGHTQVQAKPQQIPPKLQLAGKASLSSQPISQQASPAWVPSHSPDLHQLAWTPEPHQVQHKPEFLHAVPSQTKTSWIRSQNDGSVASCPPQHLGTYVQASKAPSASPKGYSSDAGTSDRLNLKGKGAELFARRQSRMEKFVVDDETVRANKARSASPSLSMPSTWKYSSNVRAPPPLSYNPILSPFYPLAAVKQPPPATSPKIKPKASKEKMNPPPKHLNVLDVMKHQPYQLNSSLFTYNSTLEAKESVSPKESKLTSNQIPTSFQTQSHAFEPPTTASPNSFSKSSVLKPSKATGEVNATYPYVRQSTLNKAAIVPHQIDQKQLTMFDGSRNISNVSGSTGGNVFVGSSMNNEYASRCALPVAPRPKFSAKKSNTGCKQWKPITLQH